MEEAGENGTKKNEHLGRNKQDGGGVVKRLPKAVMKKRNNFRLRRMLAPKAPLMVVNELVEQGPVKYIFVEPPSQPAPGMPKLYTAEATLMGETFSGTGPTQVIAKNICAEHIIQAIVTKKCNENKVKEECGESAAGGGRQEDETPWGALASLAIFKLFNDWQSQGCVLPPDVLNVPTANMARSFMAQAAQQAGSGAGGEGGSVVHLDFTNEAGAFHDFTQRPAKNMPVNPTEKHPVQLLNELRGVVQYDLQQTGEVPHCVFTMTCEVEGANYSGEGRSKKEAKKACAKKVLEAVYDITYPVC